MIEWTRNPALEEELFARLRRKYIQDRTKEIHFSDTMYCLTKAYWNKVDPLPVSNDTLGMFAIGFALEEVLLQEPDLTQISNAIKNAKWETQGIFEIEPTVAAVATSVVEYLKHPGVAPYEHEGIWFSPDYFTTSVAGEMDLKSTRMWSDPDGRPKRVADRPDGFPQSWLKQFMGYAHRLGATPGTLVGSWCPTNADHFIINSDNLECPECGTTLEQEREPDYVDYHVAILYLGKGELVAGTIRFDWEEVELNMAYHLHRAAILEDQLAQQIPPTPFVYNESWECDGCPYFNRCKTTETA